MGSIWELREPSALQYDLTLGVTSADSGSGPPSLLGGFANPPDDIYGWVRTGFAAMTAGALSNCSAYTSNSVSQYGALAGLYNDPSVTSTALFIPWAFVGGVFTCNQSHRVWCVED